MFNAVGPSTYELRDGQQSKKVRGSIPWSSLWGLRVLSMSVWVSLVSSHCPNTCSRCGATRSQGHYFRMFGGVVSERSLFKRSFTMSQEKPAAPVLLFERMLLCVTSEGRDKNKNYMDFYLDGVKLKKKSYDCGRVTEIYPLPPTGVRTVKGIKMALYI